MFIPRVMLCCFHMRPLWDKVIHSGYSNICLKVYNVIISHHSVLIKSFASKSHSPTFGWILVSLQLNYNFCLHLQSQVPWPNYCRTWIKLRIYEFRAFLVAIDYQRSVDSARDIIELGLKFYLPEGTKPSYFVAIFYSNKAENAGTSLEHDIRTSPFDDHQLLYKRTVEKNTYFRIFRGWLPPGMNSTFNWIEYSAIAR